MKRIFYAVIGILLVIVGIYAYCTYFPGHQSSAPIIVEDQEQVLYDSLLKRQSFILDSLNTELDSIIALSSTTLDDLESSPYSTTINELVQILHNSRPVVKSLSFDLQQDENLLEEMERRNGPPRPESYSPALAKILVRPLFLEDGTPILETKWASIEAAAQCIKGNRSIGMPIERTLYTEIYNYIFFREHEFGHHILGHPNCSGKTKLIEVHEYLADSFAIESMLKHLPREDVLTICQVLYGAMMNESSLRERGFNGFGPRKPRLRDRASAISDQVGMEPFYQHPLASNQIDQIIEAYINSSSIRDYQLKLQYIIDSGTNEEHNPDRLRPPYPLPSINASPAKHDF